MTEPVEPLRRPLLISGPSDADRATVGAALAGQRTLCAVVDVDDLRGLICSGGVDPWRAGAGEAQHRLAAVQACLLASSFVAAGVEIVIVDTARPAIADVYRRSAANPFVVDIDASRAPRDLIAAIEASWAAAGTAEG